MLDEITTDTQCVSLVMDPAIEAQIAGYADPTPDPSAGAWIALALLAVILIGAIWGVGKIIEVQRS